MSDRKAIWPIKAYAFYPKILLWNEWARNRLKAQANLRSLEKWLLDGDNEVVVVWNESSARNLLNVEYSPST